MKNDFTPGLDLGERSSAPHSDKGPDEGWIDLRWAAITAGLAVIIIWGSLYPFAFHERGSFGAALRYLLITSWRFKPDRGDIISNILLYLPLGYFAVPALRKMRFPMRVAVVTLGGTLLSGVMELTQFWDAGRASAVSDLYSNALGTLLGAMAAGLNPRTWNFPVLGKIAWRPFALLVIIFWLGNRLFPYVPTLYSRIFLTMPLWSFKSWLALGRYTVDWLAVGLLLEALFGLAKSRIAIGLMTGFVIAGRLIIGIAVSVEELSALLAAVIWIGFVSRISIRPALIALLFLCSVTLEALQPFHFVLQAHRFGWIPFLSLIDGLRETGVRVFFEKSFTYGALVWLMARAGLSWVSSTTICGLLVLGLRFVQVYLPGRSAEITDFTILVMLACMMKLMRDVPDAY
jgi:VanZ family protein